MSQTPTIKILITFILFILEKIFLSLYSFYIIIMQKFLNIVK
nr:MAG TPA: hypothetical protein [Caudoviricetes sp.]